MTYTSNRDIDRIGRGIENLSLPKPEWTHEAHFAAAIWLYAQAPSAPLAKMRSLIKAYNQATGVPNSDTDGYHETITRASMLATKDFLSRQPVEARVFENVNALLATAYGRPEWLLAYWSQETLFSVAARRSWVAPDLQPLPFS